MQSLRIVYTGPFDPGLCDGVSAAMHDMLVFLKSLGHEVCIITVMHENELTRGVINGKSRKDILEVLGEEHTQKAFSMNGIHVSYTVLPYSREQVIGTHGPVLKHYLDSITACQGDFFLTADNDFTCFTAHLFSGTQFLHFIHSPFVSINAFRNSPKLASTLRKRTVFTVSDYCRTELKKSLNVEAHIWEPFIDLDRYHAGSRPAAPVKTIGYYSAGAHKGDDLIRELIHEMEDHHFVIMGRCCTIDTSSANVSFLGDVTAVKEFYAGISVLLVPSTIPEGYSRVIIEAAVNGIPTIANNIGGIAEALGESGILLDIEQPLQRMVMKYRKAVPEILQNYPLYRQRALCRASEYRRQIAVRSNLYITRILQPYEGE